MKKIFIFSALSLFSQTTFSQTIDLKDLIAVYDAPYKEINTFLTKEKKYKVIKQDAKPSFTIYHYFINRDKANEEQVVTGMGFEVETGKINADLYYRSRDSSFIGNLQKQAESLGFKLDKENSTEKVRSFDYSNDQLSMTVTYSTLKNYMIFLSRK